MTHPGGLSHIGLKSANLSRTERSPSRTPIALLPPIAPPARAHNEALDRHEEERRGREADGSDPQAAGRSA